MKHEAFVGTIFENAVELMTERKHIAQRAYEAYQFGEIQLNPVGNWTFDFDSQNQPVFHRDITIWSERFQSRPQSARFIVKFDRYSAHTEDVYALSQRGTRFGFPGEDQSSELTMRM